MAAFKDFVDDAPADAPTVAPSVPPPKPAPSPPPPKPSVPKASAPSRSVTPIQIGSRIYASPLAKRLAAEKGLDLSVSNYYFIRNLNSLKFNAAYSTFLVLWINFIKYLKNLMNSYLYFVF